ncbi:PREDICTED: alpha-mannosidase 2 [Camelina sativa]|uniref:Alpha-mannosidase n=1 Tax=Camelina sativa TaxID=90675 RepID=A0ABM0TCB6_CAMSA|nr:PREDICTED: alpha-mannosidase 2 [Camelina sativa]
MPFSSYIGNTRRSSTSGVGGGSGSGWGQSLLPTALSKSKLAINRKPRKRTVVMNFLFANFFVIALVISFLFFFLTLFHFGVPGPFSSRFLTSRSNRIVKPRKNIYRRPLNDSSSGGAVVDITTKDLYDRIEFLDVDGGPWKQGWRVTYKGDEWDKEKLKIFVVPHSHNDPGWKLTVEEYYQRQSRHILDTIVETLSKDSRRKFIWEEMSYLERWWRDASPNKQEALTNLVKNGQLEIVGGGWVMNDEANSHYFAIIEQIAEGNMWLNDTIGFKYELCPWGKHPVETTQENVQERALKLLDQYRKKSSLYRTNTLLIPLGDDFRYISIDEAEAQFRNYQLLFDHINSNPSLNAEAKFGTLEDYFRTVREEADRVNYSLPGEVGSGQVVGFPSLSGDFFTYADRQQDYWSGYYVSRPFFKAVDRVLEHTLRGAEIMMSFLLGYCHRIQCEKFPTSFAYKLTAARRNLALFQHHDGVTGTAKDYVVQDYGTRMHTSLQDLQIFMSKAIEVLLGIRHEKDKSDQSPSFFEAEQVRSKYDARPVHKPIAAREGNSHTVILFNPSEQTREEVVTVVVNRAEISVLDSNWTCVPSQISPEVQHDNTKLFTGRHRLYWKASIPALGLRTYYIANGNVECEKATQSKLKYASEFDPFPCPPPYSCSKLDSDVTEIRNEHQTLVFDVKNGLLRKIVHRNGSETVVGEEIGMYSSPESGAYLFKPNGEAQPIVQPGGHIVISEGLLVQEVFSYPKTRYEKSPLSHKTRLYTGGNTLQDLVVEIEYHVELLGKDFNDQELIVRYKTDVDNKKVFYSDLNGFQMSRRETYDKIPLQGNYYPMPSLAFIQGSNGQRFSVHSRQSLGVASLREGWLEIMLDRRLVRDDGRGLGQGVMDNRAMTVVFHLLAESNISQSDHSSNPNPRNPSLLSHLVGAHLNYPINTFIAKKPQDISVRGPQYGSFAPLAKPLPCDLHIVNFKVPRPSKYSQQSEEDKPRFALILNRRAWDSAYCHKGRRENCTSVANEPVNFSDMFKDLAATKVKPTSLNLLQEDMEILGYDDQEPPRDGSSPRKGRVSISPMEIRAYKLELRPHK